MHVQKYKLVHHTKTWIWQIIHHSKRKFLPKCNMEIFRSFAWLLLFFIKIMYLSTSYIYYGLNRSFPELTETPFLFIILYFEWLFSWFWNWHKNPNFVNYDRRLFSSFCCLHPGSSSSGFVVMGNICSRPIIIYICHGNYLYLIY